MDKKQVKIEKIIGLLNSSQAMLRNSLILVILLSSCSYKANLGDCLSTAKDKNKYILQITQKENDIEYPYKVKVYDFETKTVYINQSMHKTHLLAMTKVKCPQEETKSWKIE